MPPTRSRSITQQLIDMPKASRVYSVASAPPAKGRTYALEVTRKYAPGTMGHLVHTAIGCFTAIFGDLASGRIGEHYEHIHELLSQPVTEENIRTLAVGETAYWRSEKGAAWYAGYLLDADGRAALLRAQHVRNQAASRNHAAP